MCGQLDTLKRKRICFNDITILASGSYPRTPEPASHGTNMDESPSVEPRWLDFLLVRATGPTLVVFWGSYRKEMVGREGLEPPTSCL